MVVTGEPGIGKTRLLDELAEAVAAEGGAIAHASYPPYVSLGTLQMAADIIDDLGPSGDPEVQARARSIVERYGS